MASIQGAMGAVTDKPVSLIGAIEPIAPIAPTTSNESIAAFRSANPTSATTQSGRSTFVGGLEKADRGAAGDGWAIAQVAKGRLTNLTNEARKIQAFAACSARRKTSPNGDDNANLRTDWQIRNRASSLIFQSMALLQEVEAARLNGNAVSTLSTNGPNSAPDLSRSEAPGVPQSTNPEWGQKLGRVADFATKLAALYAAKKIMDGFLSAREGHKQTEREYRQVLEKARNADRELQNLAVREARKKGIAASTLLSKVNQIMAQDRTSWDDPAKGRITENLAKSAKSQLDRMVKGDVSNEWVDAIMKRSDTYKEEAFFRPISQDSGTLDKEIGQWIGDYEKDLGVKASDDEALMAAIADMERKLAEAGAEFESAPDDIRRQRDLIYTSTVDIPAPTFDGSRPAYEPLPPADGTPPTNPVPNPNTTPNTAPQPSDSSPRSTPGVRLQEF